MKAIVVEHYTILSLLQELVLNGEERDQITTLVCCMTRDELLEDLVAAFSDVHDTQEATAVQSLLEPTINQILASKAIRLVFTPTVQHVRAYLAIVSILPNARVSILNPISLHYGSSEFSAQGFMRTLALAVEAGARNGVRLLELCELTSAGDNDSSPWDIEVPLLSDSAELDEDDNSEERTVSIRRVAERWFDFPGQRLEETGVRADRKDQRARSEEDGEIGENDMMLV